MGTRLYVGNLPFSVAPDALREAFSKLGEVVDVHIVNDRDTGQSRGFGFVTMGNAVDAATAISSMNGAMLDGRALRVNEAEERPQRGGFGGGRGDASKGNGRSSSRW
ncbi:MAG TPA: RNA-binding protein [Polyangiaceae bacterium]|nr:RNA-binding protein [Polyangiaceae bacterium]